MPLDFYKFPYPAMKNLVDQMSAVDLVRVSLQGQRADNALKACGKKNISFFKLSEYEIRGMSEFDRLELFLREAKRQGNLPERDFQLRCSLSYDLHISITCSKFKIKIYIKNLEDVEKTSGVRRNLKIGDSFVPIVIFGNHRFAEKDIFTFWNSKTSGMIALLDFFKNEFNLPISELFFLKDWKDNSRCLGAVVNHINSAQILVRCAQVGGSPPISEDDFKFVLENVSATDYFVSALTLSQNFKFNGTIRSKIIDIMKARWFTIQNVLESVESQEILVYGSNYTKDQLRTFLGEWKAGKLPKLKKLTLGTKESPLDVIEGYERWEGRCRQCESEPRIFIKVKGHGGCHGCVYTDDRKGYFMSIHGN